MKQLTRQQIEEAIKREEEVSLNIRYGNDLKNFWYKGFFISIDVSSNKARFRDNRSGVILLDISDIKNIIPTRREEEK